MKYLKSLRIQLTLSILLVLTLGLGLLLLLAGKQMSQETFETFNREQQVLALVMANNLVDPLERVQSIPPSWVIQKPPSLGDDFSQDSNINLFDQRGEQVASSGGPNNYSPRSTELVSAISGQMVSEVVENRLVVIVPVTHDGHVILGAFEFDASLDPVNGRLRSQWIALIGAAGIALILALVAAIWFSGRLTRPISELQKAAQKMSEGELSTRVKPLTSVEELASLSRMFNHMAEQIESMMQKQREFVANASHELRSPLAAIKLRAEALAYNTVTGERAQHYAAEINDEITRLAQMVGDLLQLSRAESGTFTPPDQPINTIDELNAAVRPIRPRTVSKHQEFEVELQEDIPDLYIHSSDLRIMVGNLLDNAVKYTPEGGKVSLKAIWAQTLVIIVRDNGEGIPPEDLPRISERFFRVDRAHTRNSPGVGLGLALVAATVRQYQGTLKIESEGIPGKGTSITLRLCPRLGTEDKNHFLQSHD